MDGDGCLLMNLGSLVTIGAHAPRNFVHFVFQNDCYALSGMQPLPSSTPNLCELARASGIADVFEYSDTAAFSANVGNILETPGPSFVNLKVDAEPTEFLDRMVTPRHRRRTTKEGWHNRRAALAEGWSGARVKARVDRIPRRARKVRRRR